MSCVTSAGGESSSPSARFYADWEGKYVDGTGRPRALLKCAKGFTLIELMITVLIVAILTTIAYPSYRNYVIRGQLVDATQGLSTLRANMERYFQDNRTYQDAGTFQSPCDLPPTAGGFTLSCPTLTATTYTLNAQGTSGALSGFVFSVDQANTQKTVVTAPPAPSGWASCTTAWVTRAGGC